MALCVDAACLAHVRRFSAHTVQDKRLCCISVTCCLTNRKGGVANLPALAHMMGPSQQSKDKLHAKLAVWLIHTQGSAGRPLGSKACQQLFVQKHSGAESPVTAEHHPARFAKSQQQGTGAVRTPRLTSHAGSVASCRRPLA